VGATECLPINFDLNCYSINVTIMSLNYSIGLIDKRVAFPIFSSKTSLIVQNLYCTVLTKIYSIVNFFAAGNNWALQGL